MEKKLTNNLSLKVSSVFLAFFIWLAVVNISNPDITGSREVPLEVINEEVLASSGKTYELLSDKSTVTVTYKVRTLEAGGVSASDFRAYIDLAEMYEPTGAVPIKIDVKNSQVDDVMAKPGVIRVATEDLQRKRFDLTCTTTGTAESGYRQGSFDVSPAHVYVSGPESLVGRISTVGIVVNIEGASEDISSTAPIKCFDANQNEVPLDDRVTLSRVEADYTLSILKVKTLGLNFETTGEVAEGYRYTGIESSINSVDVVGLKSDLAGISSIAIPGSDLNMEGAKSDLEVLIDLEDYLPDGVALADSSGEIRIVIRVEPLVTRTFDLKTSKISQVGASSSYSYQYDQDSIQVTIQGLEEDLDRLTDETLGAEVDVSDLGPGAHTGQVSFQLGAAYELIHCDPLQILVHDRGPGPVPSSESVGTVRESGSETEETEE